jgi:hypothetical protein
LFPLFHLISLAIDLQIQYCSSDSREEGLSKGRGDGRRGGGGLPAFLWRKSRYARMDDGGRGSSRRYVILCSVFASLNHVLLGYGGLCWNQSIFFDIFRIALFGGGLFLDEASGNTTSN